MIVRFFFVTFFFSFALPHLTEPSTVGLAVSSKVPSDLIQGPSTLAPPGPPGPAGRLLWQA